MTVKHCGVPPSFLIFQILSKVLTTAIPVSSLGAWLRSLESEIGLHDVSPFTPMVSSELREGGQSSKDMMHEIPRTTGF